MRKDDLKNKLDQRPISFNRENLWDRIDEHSNKKRRRPLFWWFFGTGMSALIIMAGINWFNLKHQIPLNDRMLDGSMSNTIVYSENESEVENVSPQHTKKEKEEENKLKSSNVKGSEKLEKEVNAQELQNRNKLTQQKEVASSKKTNFFNAQNASSIEVENTNVKNELKPESNNAISENSIKNIEVVHRIYSTRSYELISISTIKEIVPQLLILENELKFNIKKPEPIISMSKIFIPRNEFQIGIGIGSDAHTFKQDDVFNRFNIENNLESISANLFYKRHLNRNFVISAGIGFTTSQTKITDTQLNLNQYIRSIHDGDTYEITSETKRQLYNSYNRVDVSLGLAYILYMHEWQLRPYFGFGTNIKSLYYGDVITNGSEVINLNNLDSYNDKIGTFFYYGLQIDRSISKSLRMGLGAQIQSKRNLSSKQEEHIIKPFYLNLYLSKLW